MEVNSRSANVHQGKDYKHPPPTVTIRMDARKVPDTRNHGFNSKRHFLRPLPDELLYLLSGFIAIQPEIQNYLSVLGYGGMESRSYVFGAVKNVSKSSSIYFNSSSTTSSTSSANDMSDRSGNINNDNEKNNSTSNSNGKTSETNNSSSRRFRQQLDRMLRGRITDTNTNANNDNTNIKRSHSYSGTSTNNRVQTTAESDTTTSSTTSTSSVRIPVMFGAMPSSPYPLHSYWHQHSPSPLHSYWHQHSAALTLLLMLLFSLPAILVGSAFLREVRDGQLHALQALGVTVMACTGAWLIAGAVILTLLGSVLVLVTAPVLGWSALPPVLALVLFGLSLCPLAFLLTAAVHREDIYVYLLITVIFIFMLPGYVYYDTTFDIHRLVFVEILLSILSPSAAILALRRMFSALAIGEPISVFAVSHVSGVPVWVYLLLLLSNLRMDQLASQWFLEGHIYPVDTPSDTSGSVHHDADHLGSLLNITKVCIYLDDRLELFSSLSVTLRRSQLTVLMGKHGTGKSTLLRILAGLDSDTAGVSFRPYLGEVVRDGSPVRAVGYSQQQFSGFARLTVIEHLNLYNALLPSKPSASRERLFRDESSLFKTEVRELLTRLDLWHLRKEQVHTLSPSVLCRLQLALTVLGSPPLLLLDEPTSSCNAESRVLIRKEVLHYRHTNKDASIVFVSNDISELETLGGHLWLIKDITIRDFPSITKLGPSAQHDCLRLSTSDSVATELITAHLGDAPNHNWKPVEKVSYSEQLNGISRDIIFSSFMYKNTSTPAAAVGDIRTVSCWDVSKDKMGMLRAALTAIEDHEQNVPVGARGERAVPLEFSIRPCYEDSLRSLLGITPETPESVLGKLVEREGVYTSKIRKDELESNVSESRKGACEICMWLKQLVLIFELRFAATTTTWVLCFLFTFLLPFYVILSVCIFCQEKSPPKLRLSVDNLLGGESSVSLSHCGGHQFTPHYPTTGENNIWRSNVRTEWLGEECGDALRDRLGVMSVRSMKNQLAAIVLQDRDSDHDQWDVDGNGGESMAEFSVWVRVPDSEDMVATSSYLKDYFDTVVADICTSDTSTWKSGQSKSLWDFHSAMTWDNGDDDILSPPQQQQPAMSGNGSQDLNIWLKDIVCALDIHVDIRNRTIVTPGDSTTTTTTTASTTSYVVLDMRLSVDSDILVLTNTGYPHSSPLLLKEFLPQLMNVSGGNDGYGFVRSLDYELYTWPLVATNTSDLDATSVHRGYSGANAVLLYLLLLSVCTVGAVPALYASGTVLQLRLAGVSSAVFWAGNWVYEVFAVSGVMISAMTTIFGANADDPVRTYFVDFSHIFMLILVIILYVMAVTAANLCLQIRSKSHTHSVVWITITTIVFGFVLNSFFFRWSGHSSLEGSGSWLGMINESLRWISPSFAFGSCIFGSFYHRITVSGHDIGVRMHTDYQDLDSYSRAVNNCHRSQLALVVQTVVYLLLCVCVDVYWTRVQRFLWRIEKTLRYCTSYCYQSHIKSSRAAVARYSKVNQSELESGIDPSFHKMDASHRSLTSGIEMQSVMEDGNSATDTTTAGFEGNSGGVQLSQLQLRSNGNEVFRGSSASLSTGEHAVLTGGDETGQSTLLQTLVGEVASVAGEFRMGDPRTGVWMGYLPREGGLSNSMLAGQVLEIFSSLREIKVKYSKNTVISDHPLNMDGWTSLNNVQLKTPICDLSVGTQRLLALQIACSLEPSILVLDKPGEGLDPATDQAVRRQLVESLLVSSNFPERWRSLCGLEWCMDEGFLRVKQPSSTSSDSNSSKSSISMYQIDIILATMPNTNINTNTSITTTSTMQAQVSVAVTGQTQKPSVTTTIPTTNTNTTKSNPGIVKVDNEQKTSEHEGGGGGGIRQEGGHTPVVMVMGLPSLREKVMGGGGVLVASAESVVLSLRAEIMESSRDSDRDRDCPTPVGWSSTIGSTSASTRRSYMEGLLSVEICSMRMIRLNCLRSALPVTVLLSALDVLATQGLVQDYSLRTLDPERDDVNLP
eukprot:gene781-1506_t